MEKVEFKKAAKRELIEEWLKGDHVLLHIDSRHKDVDVPENLKGNPSLTLKISYRFQGATEILETGVYASLKFGDTYYACSVPWERIWGVSSESGEKKLWKEDIPNITQDLLKRFVSGGMTELAKKISAKLNMDSETKEEKVISKAARTKNQPKKNVEKKHEGEIFKVASTNQKVVENNPKNPPETKPNPIFQRIK